MNLICLDCETYFDQEYSLKKMTTEAYVRDPRFEALCLGVACDGQAGAIPQEDIAYWLKEQDWSNTGIIAHHAQFDGLILNHHYGVRPKIWLDTLSMARQVIGTHVSVSLESLTKHFGLQSKTVPYDLFKGKRWQDLPAGIADALLAGAAQDAKLTLEIFRHLATSFPSEEYPIVDMTIRMFTEPVLQADVPALRDIWVSEETKKRDMLRRLNVDAKELASAEKFAELLRERGIEPDMKVSPTGNRIYAFAKTDDFMRELVEDEDEEIALLAAARLGVKSTIDQTRAESLGSAFSRGALPVYLKYCGAHTTRWSGGDGSNWQNYRRGGAIRKAIRAPDGYKIGVVDSSQIECRVLNYVAGQWDVIERFRRKEDPYTALASSIYGRPITKDDKLERGTGKQGELSCGYQSGWLTFQRTAKLGTYGPPQRLSEDESRRIVSIYRNTHPRVEDLWRDASRLIARLAGGEPMEWRGFMKVKDGKIYGPNGSWLDYSSLRYNKDEQTWEVAKRHGWTKLYGGKLVENVIQWLAKIILSQAMRRIMAKGYKILFTVHDEIVVLLKADGSEDDALADLISELCREVPWLPGIPLAAEGGVDYNYSK